MILRICPFLRVVQVVGVWVFMFIVFSYLLYFCGIHCYFSSFLILFIRAFSLFFSVSLAKVLSQYHTVLITIEGSFL